MKVQQLSIEDAPASLNSGLAGLSAAEALREKVWPLIESGAIRPVIHATFPLVDAAKAHALTEGGTHNGKIVLTLP